MIGLIHNRSLTLEDGHYDESAAMTLISVDTENITASLGMFYEVWAMLLELVIGMTMLAIQVGWACVMPLVLGIRELPNSPPRFPDKVFHCSSRLKFKLNVNLS